MPWLVTHKSSYVTDLIDLPGNLQNYARRRLMDVGYSRARHYLFVTRDRSLAYWREVHRSFFSRTLPRIGRSFEETMPLGCERFRVIYRGKT